LTSMEVLNVLRAELLKSFLFWKLSWIVSNGGWPITEIICKVAQHVVQHSTCCSTIFSVSWYNVHFASCSFQIHWRMCISVCLLADLYQPTSCYHQFQWAVRYYPNPPQVCEWF
jgi:hypothetical protein